MLSSNPHKNGMRYPLYMSKVEINSFPEHDFLRW